MRTGTCWEAVCSGCDHATAWVWQEERPEHTPGLCGWCQKAGADSVWTRVEVKPIGLGRLSGFSTSESDFTPHWNAALGRRVRSLAEMKHLQAKHGIEDAVVKGDGADRHAPRDILRRVKRYEGIRENMEAGRSFDAGKGVRVDFVEGDD